MANIYDVPGIEGLIRSADTTMANLRNVASGSGLHEQAMRDYLNPFFRNRNVQVGKGAVGDYMSNYLKNYIDPNNQAGGKFGEGRRPNEMKVVGLGESPNPFTASGIAKAAEMAKDPSFQAENLFGEGTLTKVPGGYDYTGGKFDFNFAGPLEEKIFAPSTYGMKFDKDMNVLDKFDRDFRSFDQAKMGETNRTEDQLAMDKEIAAKGIMNNPELLDKFDRSPASSGVKQTIGSRIKEGIGSVFDKIKSVSPTGIISNLLSNINRFDDLSLADQDFITSQGLGQDKYGYNKRSMFGNYANLVKERAKIAADRRNKGLAQRAIDEYYEKLEKERQRQYEAQIQNAINEGRQMQQAYEDHISSMGYSSPEAAAKASPTGTLSRI